MTRKRSVSLHGHRTSFSLEDAFFEELRRIAENQKISLSALLSDIDDNRDPTVNFSSAIRLYVLGVLKEEARIAK